jgi:Photosynthesis affected mutant 68
MSSESPQERLPFEPRTNKKKTPKKPPTPLASENRNPKAEASLSAIPDAVSKRMIRRMSLLSGIPTALGVILFFGFYWVVSHGLFDIPPYVVLLSTMGCFGLGVLGLSYGVFSSSWDEDVAGSWLGTEEVGINFQRTIAAWRETRQQAKQAKQTKQK